MPRLYIDGSAISLSNKGVGRYSYELCRRVIDKLDKQWEIDLVVYTTDIPNTLKQNPRINLIKTAPMSDFYHNLVWLPLQIRNRKYDLLLKPMESSGIRYNLPTITVCHDVQELIDEAAGIKPSTHKKLINYIKRTFKSINLRNSAVIVCNSLFTRNAAASWYKFDVAKSVIGYCGVDERFFVLSQEFGKGNKKRHFNFNNFILTFATGDARENYCLLPELLSKMRMNLCNSKLVIAGIREDSDYINQMDAQFREFKLQSGIDYQYVDFIGEERIHELLELYATADFYLELSGHEGFGMQLAEAMACGTTCISSGAGALTEIGAGFDLQFSSYAANQIAKTIFNSYQNKLHERDNRDQVDYVRTHYTWDAVADMVALKITAHASQT